MKNKRIKELKKIAKNSYLLATSLNGWGDAGIELTAYMIGVNLEAEKEKFNNAMNELKELGDNPPEFRFKLAEAQ